MYQLFEYCTLGDLNRIINNPELKPTKRNVVKFAISIAKGLETYHQTGIIHGGVRPNNILLQSYQSVFLGASKKTELEYTRKMRHLISNFCFRKY